MQRSVRRSAARLAGGVDPLLALALLALVCIGLLMVYSASIGDAYTYYHSQYYVVKRQIVWVVLGLGALFSVARFNYHRWQKIGPPFFAVTVVMLLVVLAPSLGHASHGARRWFSLGAGITIEPSELAKLAMVIYLAAWLTTKGDAVRDFKHGFVPFSLIVGIVAALVVKQPDLGTTIVISATMMSVYFVAGADAKHILYVTGGATVFAWIMAHSSSYRYDRLMAFTNPWPNAQGSGYHTVHALMALGSGGLFGRGFGNSVEKNVLPAPHTDSILAVIGEEWGLIGTVAILGLFIVVAYRGIRISMTAPDRFGKLLAAGLTSWIVFQALLNFAVITSSVPFTGVPLPFVSYGGTALVISMTAMGILLNISRYTSGEAFARQSTDNGGRDGRPRVPRVIHHPAPDRPVRNRPRRTSGERISRPAGSASTH